MSETRNCQMCGRTLAAHAYYVVKIEVFADPSCPPLATEALQQEDFQEGFKALLAELNTYTTDELQDLVHRRFEYCLCRTCHLRYLANPLGLPRRAEPGKN